MAKGKGLYNAITVILAIILVAALAGIGIIAYSYFSESGKYETVANEHFLSSSLTEQSVDLSSTVDWAGLKEINPETIAWIYIPGTEVNYPVVQTSNNDKYIKTNFEGETNWVVSTGAIFLDYAAQPDFTSKNSVLYGHNMNDGSMFSLLEKYADPTFLAEHKQIYLITEDTSYELNILALNHINAWDVELVKPEFDSDESFQEFLQGRLDASLIEPQIDNVQLSDIQSVVTLCTCDNGANNGRYILVCTKTKLQ